jgi:hypothetical protein
MTSTIDVRVIKQLGNTDASKDFEGYYLGRFCELIFTNFPDRFIFIAKEGYTAR